MSEINMEKTPDSWVVTTLGEAFNWGSGGTPKSDNPAYYGGDIPWLVIGDMNDGPIRRTTASITDEGLAESSAKWVEPESVLVAMYGASIGKLGLAKMRLTTNQAIAFAKPNSVDSRYLFWYLRAQRDALVAQGKGGAQPNISQTVIKAFPFVLAPLSEQHRIVAEIEKQFTRLDAAVAALERAQANLKRYRASVLAAACEGRLVPTEAELARQEGRVYEPAADLLDRILAERRARWEADELAKLHAREKPPKNDAWKSKYKPPTEPDGSALPELPEGWVWVTMDSLLTGIEAGKNFKCIERPPADDEVGVVKVSAVTWGRYNEMESKTCPDPARVNPDHLIEAGDFLFSRANTIELVGACVIAESVTLPMMLSDKILRFRFVELVVPRLILHTLRSIWGRFEIERLATGNQESMRNIGQVRIRQIRIPLPPLAEQHRIVAEVERRLSVVEEMERAVETDLQRAGRLRQAILKRAFEGRLVPQDPDDEPAGALLDRIRAEGEAGSRSGQRKLPIG